MLGGVWGFARRATGLYDIYDGVKKLAHCDIDRGGKSVVWGACKLGLISTVVCQIIYLSQTEALHERQYQINVLDEETIECSSDEFTQQLNQCFNVALSFFRFEETVGKKLFFETLKEECFQLTKLVSSCAETNTRMLNFRNFVMSLADNV
ncbi:MAG: hypothetical protein WC222_04740 [Parachlamydiales bacterium]|jgi:hypothetical protein